MYNNKEMLKEKKIGEGTYGKVYSAISELDSETYAVKRNIATRYLSGINCLRELDMLSKVKDHPYIISLIDISIGDPFTKGCMSPIRNRNSRDDKIHFIMEKATYDLHELIYNTEVDYRIMKIVMLQSLLGLEYIHKKGYIHRDIKPANILIVKKNKEVTAKLADLGMMCVTTIQIPLTPQIITGWYRPPEMLLEHEFYNDKVDIWSLGCTFYEMISKEAMLRDTTDNIDSLLKGIIRKLPYCISSRDFRNMIDKGIRRTRIKLSTIAGKPWEQQLNLTPIETQNFNKHGSITAFCDLLNGMLAFNPEHRYSATEAIDHIFFSDMSNIIEETRSNYPVEVVDDIISVRDSNERKIAMKTAMMLYENRHVYDWYTHRILFLSIDLFDRYLDDMQRNKNFRLSDDEVYIYYIACLYISIKYFGMVYNNLLYEDLLPKDMIVNQVIDNAENFELELVINTLDMKIYRATLYDTADYYDDVLTSTEVRNLLTLLHHADILNGKTYKDVYRLYRLALYMKENNLNIT